MLFPKLFARAPRRTRALLLSRAAVAPGVLCLLGCTLSAPMPTPAQAPAEKPAAATLIEAEAAALPVAVAALDARVAYQGRFDRRDAAGPRCAWPASAVAIRFRGADLNVRLKGSDANRWQVEVDGIATAKLKSRGGEHRFRLASGLGAGEHTVRLVKGTETFFGVEQVLGFELSEGAVVLPLEAPRHRIEVIGDSISAGYGNEAASQEEKFSPDTENAYFTYGAIAARELGAGYTCLAWSGRKMWPNNTVPELYDLALAQDPASTWDFSAPAPDVVLINLATNDFNGKNPDEAGWTGAYKAFIARLRGHYPKAALYCAIGTMMGDWGEGKPLSTLRGYLSRMVAGIKAGGDDNVRIIDFGTQDGANGFGADWHPNVKTHRIMAAQLVKTLHDDLGW